MTTATKSIKVDSETHRWLNLLASDSGNHVYQLLRHMAEAEMKKRGLRLAVRDGSRVKGGK